MDFDASHLMLGLLFGTIGMGMFIFGKRTQHLSALGAGLGLMVFPYFVSNIWAILAVGTALTATPFVVRGR